MNTRFVNNRQERLISPNSPEDLILQNPSEIMNLKLEKKYSMNIEEEEDEEER